VWDENTAARTAKRLVYSYPSHGYIIDFNELSDMGFQARLFGESERAPAQALLQYTDGNFIVLVDP